MTEEVLGLLELEGIEFQEFWSIELMIEFNHAFLYNIIDGTELNLYGSGYLLITLINQVSYISRAKLFSVSNHQLLSVLKEKHLSTISFFTLFYNKAREIYKLPTITR